MGAGEIIKMLREEKGWSQNRLSKESGVPQSSISYYELGEREISISYAVRLAEALGCDVLQIIWEELKINRTETQKTYGDPTIEKITDMLSSMTPEQKRKVLDYTSDQKQLSELKKQ